MEISDFIPADFQLEMNKEIKSNNPAAFKKWVAGLRQHKNLLDVHMPRLLREFQERDSELKKYSASIDNKLSGIKQLAHATRMSQSTRDENEVCQPQ